MFRPFLLWLCVAAGLLAACGGASTPQLIGSYPSGETGPVDIGQSPPINDWSPPPQNLYITYNAALGIEVEHPAYAVYSVKAAAEQYGGYLLTSRTWFVGGDEYAEATVAVPVGNFEAVKSRLKSLGEVKSESISGELRDATPGWSGASQFSHITVSFSPSSANWGWKVAAFFGGLLKGIGWILLIVSPPALMLIGLGTVVGWVRAWFKRGRSAQP